MTETPALEPAPDPNDPEFVHFSLERFLVEKALWAANYYVLWPIGLALTATVEKADGLVVKVHDVHVREWTYSDGHLETIDQPERENAEDRAAFLEFVRERILEMAPAERQLALERLARHGIATPEQILAAP